MLDTTKDGKPDPLRYMEEWRQNRDEQTAEHNGVSEDTVRHQDSPSPELD